MARHSPPFGSCVSHVPMTTSTPTTSASTTPHRPPSLPLPPRILPDGRQHVINLAWSSSSSSSDNTPPETTFPTSNLYESASAPASTRNEMMLASSAVPRLDIARLSPPPSIATSHSTRSAVFSPMERARRTAPPDNSPPMTIQSSPLKHTLQVKLPVIIQPEMVTISANKGDKLKVIADAWHLENDCHYEWIISFPPRDIDMSGVHARFEPDGTLVIDVRRFPRHSHFARPVAFV
ncbi:hypothetical protein WG66_008963 [Moniliophthora roreri]|uniref:SHSP domain-containing protein n=1 Tax=Moniliophthora roreri TaxID=221103 RepID=A0A0W0EU93_MONRR|nr:hypothetical protein WG66_008963 [Moniliophthora roreri]